MNGWVDGWERDKGKELGKQEEFEGGGEGKIKGERI